jgi:thiosulfate dehydrogenase [quinone] large subunit
LLGSVGPLASIFKGLALNESMLNIVDILNTWGLILIGLGLFIGLFSKPCAIFGMVLLLLYYIAYPPFNGLDFNTHVEGSYWIVNKNLIEMAALFVLYLFPSSHITGIDRFSGSYLARIKQPGFKET